MGNICWFTNLAIEKRHQPLDLFRRYTPEAYPKYDTYDAIDCARTSDIPMDYDGVIGVTAAYMAYHCPEQFEIVGEFNHGIDGDFDLAKPTIDGKAVYKRIAIRRVKTEP